MFKNRKDAALQLLQYIKKYKGESGVILAIPRGGVPMGYILAEAMDFPLELVLTKKIGHPLNKEYAIGSVSLSGRVLSNTIGVSQDYIEQETQRIRKKLKEQYTCFMGERKPLDIQNKTAIIVDDGVATGSTLLVTIELIKKMNPSKIVVAVPVAPPQALIRLKGKVDQIICLHTPADFMAVGQYYENFQEVTDEEVIEYMTLANMEEKESSST